MSIHFFCRVLLSFVNMQSIRLVEKKHETNLNKYEMLLCAIITNLYALEMRFGLNDVVNV